MTNSRPVRLKQNGKTLMLPPSQSPLILPTRLGLRTPRIFIVIVVYDCSLRSIKQRLSACMSTKRTKLFHAHYFTNALNLLCHSGRRLRIPSRRQDLLNRGVQKLSFSSPFLTFVHTRYGASDVNEPLNNPTKSI